MPEVYFPGSSVPFRPVNAHGRAMPKVARSIRQPLYQLIVTRKGRGQMPFGPKMEKQFAQELYETVLGQIRLGKEKDITDPHLVLCV